jgi:hypothetical protein
VLILAEQSQSAASGGLAKQGRPRQRWPRDAASARESSAYLRPLGPCGARTSVQHAASAITIHTRLRSVADLAAVATLRGVSGLLTILALVAYAVTPVIGSRHDSRRLTPI